MKYFKKLNQKGFSHHILVPIAVIAVVTAIGSYVLVKSKAATPTSTSQTNKTVTVTAPDYKNDSTTSLQSKATLQLAATVTPPAPNIVNYPPTIKYGDYNHTVGILQLILTFLNTHSTLSPLYHFGQPEKDNVLAIQFYNGLARDGIVGTNTWRVLLTAFNNNTSFPTSPGAPSLSHFSATNSGSYIKLTAKYVPTQCKMMFLTDFSSSIPSVNVYMGINLYQGESDTISAIKGTNVIGARFSQCTGGVDGAWAFVNILH